MSVYLVNGKATLEGKNGSLNITGGESATILKNGSLTMPSRFNENDIKEKTGIRMDTMWKKEIELKRCIICKNVDEREKPVKETTSFFPHDTVYVWLDLVNASGDDKIKWVFEGPNNITQELNYTINWSGNGYCYAYLSMQHYGDAGIGEWNVATYINGEKAADAHFTVKQAKTSGFEFIALAMAILFILKRKN